MTASIEAAAHLHTTAAMLLAGARGRCPRCGQGALFAGFLTVTRRCSACGLSFAGHDAGDGPAVFGIFILGFVVVGLAVWLEAAFEPPLWVHALVWIPVTIAASVGLLRPLKGMTIAAQYRFRSVEERERPGAT
ncbi:MAG: DUF983 domain-containing protein [Defluviicoccus sp.]|nr:DUF983 domain-containing protein [Defluviicoccus sp.]MDG4592032.1 DUF983 domain-containing protein [Defluviicoccus sp.]MDS4012561.1 DUF983 domain-containing protein [Defluviicoccus sp.]MDS4073396.1 DUF983 domain-containing protein [Defluviicoccus sp.]